MDFAQQQRNPGRHLIGFGIVVALHVLLGWALVTGLAQRMIEVIKAPIETKIIEEVKPPEPPPPENLPPPPKFAPPPPSFVPPPEVNVAPPVTPMRITPAPAVAASAPPAPRAPARTEPRIDFQNACERPEYNAAARRAEAQGSTTILFTMDTTGQISEATVEKSSGPSREHKMLDRLALEAVRNCKGTPGTVDGKPEKLTSRITYVWRITD